MRRTHPLQQSATQAYLTLRLPRRKFKSVSYGKDGKSVEGNRCFQIGQILPPDLAASAGLWRQAWILPHYLHSKRSDRDALVAFEIALLPD